MPTQMLNRPLRPVHLVVTAGILAFIGGITFLAKVILTQNYTPEVTEDANGVVHMAGPQGYDNLMMDVIVAGTAFAALALVIVAAFWRYARPMM